MSLLAVGISHHTAPIEVLERLALDADSTRALAGELTGWDQVREVAVLATCNRLEVYADVTTFHGGLAEVGRRLVERSSLDLAERAVTFRTAVESCPITGHRENLRSQRLATWCPGPGMVPGHMDRVMPAGFDTAAPTPVSRQAA